MATVDDPALEEARAAAERLAGRPVERIVPIDGGGNSRVYRVACGADAFALKRYPTAGEDTRDRAGVEFRTLQFLERHGVANVPKAYAICPEQGYCLLEWVEGEPIAAVGQAEIDAAVDFIAAVWRLNGADGAADMPPASEACLSGAEIVRQIEARWERLSPVAADDSALADYLTDRLGPALDRFRDRAIRGYGAAGLGFEAAIPPARRCLIPADFGYHNALRRADGIIVFIDFEYFGWDDPVKLTADFLLHPAMKLGPGEISKFRTAMIRERQADAAFDDRLNLLMPLFAIRWCLILLNDFLPDHWRQRHFADDPPRWTAAKARQLGRAQRLLSNVSESNEDVAYER